MATAPTSSYFKNLYFKDQRLEMNVANRLISRLIIYSFYAVFTVAAVAFLISPIPSLFWLGIGFLLFLIDRALHFGQAERSLIDLARQQAPPQLKINLAQYLTPASFRILETANEKSLIMGGDFYLYVTQLLAGERDIQTGLWRMDVDPKELKQKIDDLIASSVEVKKAIDKNTKRKEAMEQISVLTKKSFEIGLTNQDRFIEPVNLFSALGLINDAGINQIFHIFSIDPYDLDNALIFGRFRGGLGWLRRLPAVLGGFAHRPYFIRHRIMNRAWTARPTPTLDKYSQDLTDLAREGRTGFLIGHQKEYDHLLDILSRPTKANVLLVGESGSGKETVISHLAFEIIKDKTPAPLFDKRVAALQVGSLISGASAEEVALRVNKIVEEINAAGNIILYIPDIHNLVKTSGQNYLSAADILIPVLVSDAFPVIGATYPREYKQMVEPRSDFSGAFEVVHVEEISEEEAIKLLSYQSILLEQQYKIIISFRAIKQAVLLAHKYFRAKLLPSSAEDLLKESLADASQRKEKVLTADMVINIAERKSNIPIHRAGKEEAEKLLDLEEIIHQKLINQEEAVKAVSRALREYRSGLSRPGGPIAVFLFVGPTGVGKTELSKILAKIQFGSENLMIRFDMSEYQDKQSIFRFIGSPDGTIAGSLTEAVVQKPYSLILLDEFEKAHSDILNLFLQVFDDGRLTDNLGRTVDFTNTIIIATSNAHSDLIKKRLEEEVKMAALAEEIKKKLTDYFRPELLNRFSNIIVFKNLTLAEIEKIAKLLLNSLNEETEVAQGISLVFREEAIKEIARLGYDPVFGARPLRGVISEKIRSVLAEKILKGETNKGSNIKVNLENSEFTFHTF